MKDTVKIRCFACGNKVQAACDWQEGDNVLQVVHLGPSYICHSCKTLFGMRALKWFFETEKKPLDMLFERG